MEILHTRVNYTPGGKAKKWIVIHYTGNQTDTARANALYFRLVNRGASAHYFVDESEIYEVVSPTDTAWAVGVNYGKNNLFGVCTNSNSISIEMCSRGGVIQSGTVRNTVALTKDLMQRFGIPADHVVRHWDVCSKRCPGWSGWLPPDEHLWKDFKARLSTTKEGEGEEEMRCLFQIDGKATVYYFDGTRIVSLSNPDQMKILQTIYKDCNGRELPYYKWSSKAPWYQRLQQVLDRKPVSL